MNKKKFTDLILFSFHNELNVFAMHLKKHQETNVANFEKIKTRQGVAKEDANKP